MLDRACSKLLSFKNIVVINDEAHHCYRERALSEEERLDREAQAEARENNEAARLWISGIEALKRKVGLRAVYGFMKQSLRVVVYKHEGKAEARCLPRPGLELSLSCVAP